MSNVVAMNEPTTPTAMTPMDMLQLAGARVAVAHSLDEALYTLECWGIIKRDHASRNQILSTEDQSRESAA